MTLPDIPEAAGQLAGWKEIARFLNRGVSTVQRWEKELALPVRRTGTASATRVSADPREIASWRWRQAPAFLTLEDVDRALEAAVNTDDAFLQFVDLPDDPPAATRSKLTDIPPGPEPVTTSLPEYRPGTSRRFGRSMYAVLLLSGLGVLWAALAWAQ